MSSSFKKQQLRERMQVAVKQSKQTTFDSLPKLVKNKLVEEKLDEKKRILITQIDTVTKEDELELKVSFALFPSRLAFSRLRADLFFDSQKLCSSLIRILQGPIATDYSEFASVLNMKGIPAGSHVIKVEMYELWSNGEKLSSTSKETAIDYVPLKRENRLIKIPIVKGVVGADLVVVSDSDKDIYREIENDSKREFSSKRDEW